MQVRNLRAIIYTCAVVLTLGVANTANAQLSTNQLDGRINVINTAVPFLRIDPEARSGAMGDVGIAIAPDANSIQWNMAKVPFATNDMSLSMTYTPWLRELVNDIYLAYLAGYIKLDEAQGVAASLRYFSLGDITFTNVNGEETGQFRPHEFSFDLGYARKFTDDFSTGLTLKFIYSNLAAGQSVNNVDIHPGIAVAADVSMYYEKEIEPGDREGTLAFGANLSNVGSKITYTKSKEKDFIPTNLGIGTALTIVFNDYNKMTYAIDVNKLMVPTPDTTPGSDFRTMGVVEGMFSSFGDAPGGFQEEMQEFMLSFGTEYWYMDQFAVRAGYFHEHKLKGNRKYFTLGVGLKYNVFGLNFSYLVPTTSQRSPLDNTLRFSLLFDFEALKSSAPSE
jgi:hypothetical protein